MAADRLNGIYCSNNPINFNDPEGKFALGGLGVAGGILLGKGIALGVSYFGVQAATHAADNVNKIPGFSDAPGLPEDPYIFGNRVWSGALEANRVQLQVAMELSPLDRPYDIISSVWGKDLLLKCCAKFSSNRVRACQITPRVAPARVAGAAKQQEAMHKDSTKK